MLHLFFFGFLLGLGAAVPIGPICLEMIRRNLRYGTKAGMALGIGACSADVAYLILFSLGVLHFLSYPPVLKTVGIVGSLVLGWFGFSVLRLKSNYIHDEATTTPVTRSFWRDSFGGFLLTLVNPMTIVFWSSVSATIAVTTGHAPHAVFYAALGVLSGAFSWVLVLNLFIHHTRHRLSRSAIHKINIIGGVILLAFAVIGFWHAV